MNYIFVLIACFWFILPSEAQRQKVLSMIKTFLVLMNVLSITKTYLYRGLLFDEK